MFQGLEGETARDRHRHIALRFRAVTELADVVTAPAVGGPRRRHTAAVPSAGAHVRLRGLANIWASRSKRFGPPNDRLGVRMRTF